jgi:hypothetical protein
MAGLDPANHVSVTAGEERRGCPAIAGKLTQAAMAAGMVHNLERYAPFSIDMIRLADW